MNCNCEFPARYLISREGKPCYACGLGRCRFYALSPVQCEGYTRVTLGAPGCPPADSGVVMRFEAVVHPDHTDVAAFTVRVQGDAARWDSLRREVLQDAQYGGMWYPAGKAFLYPMTQYARLVQALKARATPAVALEEIPPFYFRCVERLRLIPLQYSEAVAAGNARRPDPDDCVFRQLKPFQKDGVRFILAHEGRGMIADDMGLGKTVQAIAVAHHYRDEWPVLVVCPMSLLENWAKEFNKFCGIPYTRIAILQGAKAKASDLHSVVIVSYSSLKCVEQERFNVVILDESHYIKAGAAKRAQLSLQICRDSRRVLLLSGTPAMSRPIELYAQLQAIHPNIVPSKTHFGARYCNSYVSRFGVDLTGHSHTDELHCLLRHYVIRRTKKELGNELPSKTRQLLYVYVTEKEKKAMEKQVVALRRSLASAAASSPSSPCVTLTGGGAVHSTDLSARTNSAFEMKMATARAKIPAVQDYVSTIVEQHLDSGEKLILFAHHQVMMDALKAAVEAVRPRQPIDYIFISGDTPAAQREPAAEHFRNESTCTVAILSMQSSGTGHNFTCASTVVFTELDWNPSTHLQCEDRVHRIGQAQPCHIKYLLAEGTSDSVIWPLLQTKLTVTTAMFENTGAAAEVHLYDGADKQNVARRDVAAVAGRGSTATAGSTPSSSQQSTLDRFVLQQPSPSQSLKGGDDAAGVAASAHASPRASLHAAPAQPRISTLLSAEHDDGDSASGPPLLLTPPNLSQQLSDSLMNSPLSASRRGQGDAPAAPDTPSAPAPSHLVSFEKMGNAFASSTARPPHNKHAASSSGGASTATATASGAPGSSASAAAPVVSTSVLDLLRQTSTTSPPKRPGGPPPTAVVAGSASRRPAPVVVGLTESTPTPPSSLRLVQTGPTTTTRPLSAPPTTHPPTLMAGPEGPGGTSVSAAAPRRRTVFTFGAAASTSTTSAPSTTTAAAAPAASAEVNALPASSAVLPPAEATATFSTGSSPITQPSAPPAPSVPASSVHPNGSQAAPVSTQQAVVPTPSTTNVSAVSVSMRVNPNRSPAGTVGSSSTSNGGGGGGAIHIPLRPHLHFKRTRSDGDLGSGVQSASTSSGTYSNAPAHASPMRPGDPNGGVPSRLSMVAAPSSSPPVRSPAPIVTATPQPPTGSVSFSRAAVTLPAPVSNARIASMASVPADGFSLSVPITAAGVAASTSATAAPRRTLFKLVSNVGPEHLQKKD